MVFIKGHKLNIGNQYAKGTKHTEEWKQDIREKMLGNTNGFTKGKPSPRKGKKSLVPVWNKGLKLPQFSGENHPRWVKDRSAIKGQDRKDNPLYKEWRKKVWSRDGYSCQIRDKHCSGRIEAHHILPWRKYLKLRYEVNNGITLCRFHHPLKAKDEIKMAPVFTKIIDSDIAYLNKKI